ncbi:MAG TPA: beta-ketoacyl-ACP synthase III, partial [Microlunatus sp.]|nr:beta-ketoacyl-ACP synthase III [Microlunatus sp.]
MTVADDQAPARLRTSTGHRYARILGVGGYRPRRVVDNAEMCTMIESTEEWIQTRTGIIERRWASPDETVHVMSLASARKAIQRAGLEPAQIDTVIVSTVTHLLQTPSAAATIAHELGATGAAAFDISAACAGFCYGVTMADSLVRSGASTYVLVIGVERLSDFTNRGDRSAAFIFADGAGAAVVGPSPTPAIGPVVWGSDGEHADLITQTEPWDQVMESPDPHWPALRMDGNPVFKWASFTMAKAAREALDRAGVGPDEIEVFVPHQANMRIIDAMLRALRLPANVVVARDIERQGNSSAASIPLAMEALMESGQARSG